MEVTNYLLSGMILQAGDSIPDLFIPDRWRSPTSFEKGSRELTIPERSQRNGQADGDFLCGPSSLPSDFPQIAGACYGNLKVPPPLPPPL